jgi:hypothetical protein
MRFDTRKMKDEGSKHAASPHQNHQLVCCRHNHLSLPWSIPHHLQFIPELDLTKFRLDHDLGTLFTLHRHQIEILGYEGKNAKIALVFHRRSMPKTIKTISTLLYGTG